MKYEVVSNTGAARRMVLIAVLALALPVVADDSAAEDPGQRTILFDPQGEWHVTLVLRNTQVIDELPSSAESSVLSNPIENRKHVGAIVPEGAVPGDEEWNSAALVSENDAKVTVTAPVYSHDGRRLLALAGYQYPAKGEARRPWMSVAGSGILVNDAVCEFVVESESGEEPEEFKLLEVAAIDKDPLSRKVYFHAVTSAGDPTLLSSDYFLTLAPRTAADAAASQETVRNAIEKR